MDGRAEFPFEELEAGAELTKVPFTFLSFWYLLQTSFVRPPVALVGLSGGTMVWFTRADRCVRTVDK